MVKRTITKIISGAIIVTIFFTYISPISSVSAAVGTRQLNWENPNKKGNNPFQFKLKDSLNSNLIMNVIGCTGVVNKISGAVTGFAQDIVNKKIALIKERAVEKVKQGTANIALQIIAATSTSPGSQAGTGMATIGSSVTDGIPTTKTSDEEGTKATNEVAKMAKTQQTTEQCLNGIAYTLAKNQLTAMTRSTMNWVTTGFGGDPMYVQNMNSFMNNITSNILEKEIYKFTDPNLYPYGSDYARGAIGSYRSSKDLTSSLTQNLTNYLNFGGLGNDAADLITSKYKYSDRSSIDRYSNDFSAGGWNGWLALTQREQNNPLGFNIKMSQNITDKQTEKTEEIKTELVRNKGVLDQKKCVKYAPSLKSAVGDINTSISAADENYNRAYDAYSLLEGEYNTVSGDPTRTEELNVLKGKLMDAWLAVEDAASITKLNPDGTVDECVEWQVITPGSVIQDKISTYVNSPERQLELADTINKSLNALFTALISKLQHEGLSSLGSSSEEFSSTTSGLGTNRIFDTSGTDITESFSTASGFEGPFDITKDLGNIYTKPIPLGEWDAVANKTTNTMEPSLSKDVGTKNTFYVVTNAKGNTQDKILFEGNTGWKIGDRAFFDGETWKKGVPDYVLSKRGILQLQQDYINNAQRTLKIIPKTMPAIGELDYCIPGPNPNWQGNTADAYVAYTDWLYGIGIDQKARAFLRRTRARIMIPETTSLVFRAYKKIFDGTGLWDKVRQGIFFNDYIFSPDFYSTDWIHPFPRHNTSCGSGTPQTWWVDEKCIGQALQRINEGQQKWIDYLDSNLKDYIIKANNLFWSNKTNTMNNPFESNYVEMAQTGLAITKNIVEYGTDIDEATIRYQDAIVESCANIYKLNKIKEEVNVIVKAAQARRAASGIKVDPSCTEAELGTYLVEDKPLLKGCGNTIIEDTPEMITAKQLEADRLWQEGIDAQNTANWYSSLSAEFTAEESSSENNTPAPVETSSVPMISGITTNYIQAEGAIVAGNLIYLGNPPAVSGYTACFYPDGSSESEQTCMPMRDGTVSTGSIAIPIYPLTPDTKYWYSIYAENSSGKSSMTWHSFTTLAAF